MDSDPWNFVVMFPLLLILITLAVAGIIDIIRDRKR